MVDGGLTLDIVMLLGGLVLLVFGGDKLVDGSAALASLRKLSPVLVGMTIVAFGTSLPEMAVNLIAAFDGEADLAMGNIVGSNIANILLILGLTALLYPVKSTMPLVHKDMPLLIGLTILTVVLVINFTNSKPYEISAYDGVLLILVFGAILYTSVRRSLRLEKECRDDPTVCKLDMSYLNEVAEAGEGKTVPVCVGYIVGGLVGVIIGGKLLVEGAVGIAEHYNVDSVVIGLTILAFGTSVPELVTSSIAALKKHPGLVLGNVVGSNMFNLFILGMAAIITPLKMDSSFLVDLGVMTLVTIVLLRFLATEMKLERWEGGVFFAGYLVYIGYVLSTVL